VSLIAFTLRVHDALDRAQIAHAFGGALALDYLADPRGTVDVDVNVFSTVSQIDDVLAALAPLGLEPEGDLADWVPVEGLRLRSASEPYPVDVFPALDPAVYAEIEARVVHHPFGPDRRALPFLSAEDLVVFKLSFGRAKDWVDLASIAASIRDLDLDYVEGQLIALRGPAMYPRMARLRSMVRAP
jgi:hypothetical protein